MAVDKFIRNPLWATLVGALVAAMVVSVVVFVQSGEAVPQAADEQTPYASVSPKSPLIVGGTAVPNGKYPFMVALLDKRKTRRRVPRTVLRRHLDRPEQRLKRRPLL
jgi:hypothetical protein